ncbi:MAG: alanine racemase [Rikenellaceae bacterium]|nr:alanine racemase [Rikenellaceae bacterium]
MRYRLSDIARITGGRLTGEDRPVRSVLTDSRMSIDFSEPVFVALRGNHRDGHQYLDETYRRGVRAFLVNRNPEAAEYPEAGFVVVNDTLEALQQWAAYHRRKFRGVVAGITGSNGKTIVKEWIVQMAPQGYKVFRSPRSYNSQIGVPLSLLMIRGDEQVAVIEAGISRPGEMERLEQMIRPDIAVLTNIGSAHREGFADQDQKIRGKLLLAKDSRTVVYPSGDLPLEAALRRLLPDKQLVSTTADFDAEFPFADPISIVNARTALAFWTALGIPPREVVQGLKRLQPVAMRLEMLEGIGGSKIINDSYNADINSLSAALDAMQALASGQKKVVILSDIYQTGLTDAELYGEVSRLLDRARIDGLIGIGERISSCAGRFTGAKAFYPTTERFLDNFDRTEFIDKTVLIKGSRSFRFERISRMLEKQVHTTVLEIDLDAMIRNLNHYRSKLLPQTKIMAMVKAFSYGSGAFEVAATLQRQGVAYLAVAFADEGVLLREAGITIPIVVLNADSGSFGPMIDYRLEPEIYSFLSLKQFVSELKHRGEPPYPIHISFDTGMHRLGFMEGEVPQLIALLREHSEVYVRSAFTHFAASDEPQQDDFTRKQLHRFLRIGAVLREAFPQREIALHAANTAGIERFAEARELDMIRLGIGLYGISSFERGLEAVGTLKSRIVQIKNLQPGETVGYGRHGKIRKASKIATLPVGYADGLDRRLGRGAWKVRVSDRFAPTIGNICMDTCMIDITGIDAHEGDEVVIVQGAEAIIEMAELLQTIPYEILTSISSRVKRVFLKE